MKEKKGCYAKEIMGKRISRGWVTACSERSKKNICCRDCDWRAICYAKCIHSSGKCGFYTSKKYLKIKRLAFKLDPSSLERLE